jgi:catalase
MDKGIVITGLFGASLAACAASAPTAPVPAAAPALPAAAPTAAPVTGEPASPTGAGTTYSPAQLVEGLHEVFGNHHARAVHARGIVLTGEFTPDEHAAELTRAPHLQKAKSPVVVRFSDFSGVPDAPENSEKANPRGMAIKFPLPDGAVADIVCNSFNGFPVATTDQFRAFLSAVAASGPTAAKPTALDRFLQTHEVAKTFLTTQKNPASYATISYFGVNSFKMTNAGGVSHYVRYVLVPADGEQLFTKEQMARAGRDYLQDEIQARVARRPVKFKLFAQVAESGDKIEDPSIAWPDTRTRVPLGTFDLQKLGSNTPAQDRALAFSAGNVTDGIEPADPMISFRARAYPISVKERQ